MELKKKVKGASPEQIADREKQIDKELGPVPPTPKIAMTVSKKEAAIDAMLQQLYLSRARKLKFADPKKPTAEELKALQKLKDDVFSEAALAASGRESE